MQKFLIKYFILFILAIWALFFGLIAFQDFTMQRAMPPNAQFQMQPPPDFDMENGPMEEPPIYIPTLLIVLLSSFLVFILLKYLDTNFISPLLEIKRGVKEIKEGSLDVEFKGNSDDKTVQDTFDGLNSMVVGLKEKEKFRENFVSMLSHDLRTPILAQERAISILKDEFQDNELLDGMVENNKEYLSMINLIIETFVAGDMQIKKEIFNLSDLVNTLLLALIPSADLKNIKIIVDIDKNYTLNADYISFHRILMNLISNSIENIGNDKTVKITAKDDEITVMDNGEGIDEAILAHIFDKYASFRKGAKTVGGLGLYIAYELTKKNGYKLTVESKKGEYTKFTIR